jgi:D-serine dehydratase
MMQTLMSGAFTVTDENMLNWQERIRILEGIRLEPSACAGFGGLKQIEQAGNLFAGYLQKHGLQDHMEDAVHIVWGTGGGLMPEE